MTLFKSKPQRILKKARDMAAGDMVDQAAVLMEEEIEGLLEEKDAATVRVGSPTGGHNQGAKPAG